MTQLQHLLHYATELSTYVKVGWICWLAAAVVQIVWFRAVRDLPEIEPDVEVDVDDHSTGWPPIAETRPASILGVSHIWEPSPAPASGPALEAIDYANAPSPDGPPSGWVELASDISPTIDEPPATRRAKRRRRSIAPSIA